MKKKRDINSDDSLSPKLIIAVISVIIVIGVLSYFIAEMLSGVEFGTTASVAVIKIEGPIYTKATPASLFSAEVASSDVIVEQIEDAQESGVDAILFEINSPGGTVVASAEIARAIQKVNVTTVAWIREVGASGAYWAAASSDVIIADPMAITGSIGVISSYLQFEGLMDEYGVKYERLVGGDYKDAGSPYKNLTAEERQMLQSKIDKIHEYFIQEVARERNIPIEDARELATGMFYLGTEAKENGLVDRLGGKDEVEELLKEILGTTDIRYIEKEKQPSFIEMLTQASYKKSFYLGRGIGSAMLEQKYDKMEVMLI